MEKDFLAEYVIELWKKRYVIIAAGFLCGLLTFCYCKFIAKEVFESTAQIYIREKPNYTNAEREQVNPLTFETLLKSAALINEVRNEYVKKSKIHPPMLELFIKDFKVKTNLVEDTTIRKKVSPLIEISVRANSRENAKLLMEIWTSYFIKKYGDIVAKDAEFVADYFSEKLGDIETKLKEKEKEYTDIKWQLPMKIKELANLEDQLAPGQMFFPMSQKEPRILGPYNFQDMKVEVQPANYGESAMASGKIGLKEKLRLHEIKIEEAKRKGEAVKNLSAEYDALVEVINKAEKEIIEKQKQVADLEQKYESVGREVEVLKQQFQLTSSMFSQTDLEARAVDKKNRGELEGSDVLVMSPATLPDKRVFPRVTLFSLISFALGIMLCASVLIVRKYIFDAEEDYI